MKLPKTLTPAERKTTILAINGLTNKQIAKEFGCREQTIKDRMTNVFWKNKVKSRFELIAKYRRITP